ncbi:H-NS histone family protein [Delftia sp. PS-11]|uniref:H-NS histone family protein n=1 Tax=Delftia sp. PS-11 TaxID=2767222 RepID=UPI0024546E1E|nr:H-NS histone family protein [Delftia sp. PS-11]KAJ8744182.1 H-NS histone family protein [Delftia sp. PS-11]
MTTLRELVAAKAALEAEIAKARKNESAAALARVQQLVSEFGFTTEQLFPLLPHKAKTNGVAKYRDPASGATWTGRGKPPAWIVGKNRDELLIDEPVRETFSGPYLAEMAAAAARN